MPFTQEDFKRASIKAKARKFAFEVRESNMALAIPDELADIIPDDMWPYFRTCCDEFRITQRKDFLWESK